MTTLKAHVYGMKVKHEGVEEVMLYDKNGKFVYRFYTTQGEIEFQEVAKVVVTKAGDLAKVYAR